MIAALPDAREAPGFSVGQETDAETASHYASAHICDFISRAVSLTPTTVYLLGMSSLKPIEKRGFEELFGMASGYVLDFTNQTYAQFFRDTAKIDIYHAKYSVNGDSKARRLRAFWEIEADPAVGKVLGELLDLWEYENRADAATNVTFKKCREVVGRLSGKNANHVETAESFLDRSIVIPSLGKLNLDPTVTAILEGRLKEIELGLKARTPLSVIMISGSILEGALLGIASQSPADFNRSGSSPKDKTGKVKPFPEWSLAQFIDVACDLALMQLDVKKFSHVLRDFRNYIHPYEQMASGFTPDMHTAEICFQVLKAALADLGKSR